MKFTKTSINIGNKEDKSNQINRNKSSTLINLFIKNKPKNETKLKNYASSIETRARLYSHNIQPITSKTIIQSRNEMKEMITLYKQTGIFINMKKRSKNIN
jgi:hypothetical protein